MTHIGVIAFILVALSATKSALANDNVAPTASSIAQATDQQSAGSNVNPVEEKRQEKRYVGYNGVGGYGYDSYYNNPYSSRLLSDPLYNSPGIGGAVGGYSGFGYSGLGTYNAFGGYTGSPYSYYYSRANNPYNRLANGYGYGGYPSSYYSNYYGNSIVGGGLGGLGIVPPIAGLGAAGYQYGPGISGSIY